VINLFSKAYEVAFKYTCPVIISSRTIDNVDRCGGGAFVIINDEGWIITAAHILDTFKSFNENHQKILKYQQEVDNIKNNKSLKEKNKKIKIKSLNKEPNWLTHISYLWDGFNRSLLDVKVLVENDLAVGRLDPFVPRDNALYPVFKNPDEIKYGTSLCKLGFPFHNVTATYSPERNTFDLSDGALPVPIFPIEGIYTRDEIVVYQDGKTAKYLETSSPGLRGQSGGPIFDAEGKIWAIQSHTDSLPLEFSTVENQYINVGKGVHPEVIKKILDDNGIKYSMSD